eukprot:GHVQ01031949.1.p1 GENE.GHVQ01031949.1~~GHVQ01031949.1.p1  ORF type:complete len:102 (-),score=3.28 GHVQ01031949.1:689-994(-)
MSVRVCVGRMFSYVCSYFCLCAMRYDCQPCVDLTVPFICLAVGVLLLIGIISVVYKTWWVPRSSLRGAPSDRSVEEQAEEQPLRDLEKRPPKMGQPLGEPE